MTATLNDSEKKEKNLPEKVKNNDFQENDFRGNLLKIQ